MDESKAFDIAVGITVSVLSALGWRQADRIKKIEADIADAKQASADRAATSRLELANAIAAVREGQHAANEALRRDLVARIERTERDLGDRIDRKLDRIHARLDSLGARTPADAGD